MLNKLAQVGGHNWCATKTGRSGEVRRDILLAKLNTKGFYTENADGEVD
jgi:hypothetical protein